LTDEPPQGAGSGPDDERPVARYGLGRFLADGWAEWRRRPRVWLGVFIGLHVAAALVPFLIFFDVPDDGTLAIVFLVRVVVPLVAGSVAVALATHLARRGAADDPATEHGSPSPSLEGKWVDLLSLALFAALLGVVLVLFLGAYGFLILHFVYGPPIAAQVLLFEGLPFREALVRTRLLLAGNWRMVLYLLTVAIVIGLIGFVVVGALYSLVDGRSDTPAALVLSVGQALVVGALTSYLGAAQTGLYLSLSAKEPSSMDGTEATEETASQD
jgi:nitrate reductase NapE component